MFAAYKIVYSVMFNHTAYKYEAKDEMPSRGGELIQWLFSDFEKSHSSDAFCVSVPVNLTFMCEVLHAVMLDICPGYCQCGVQVL